MISWKCTYKYAIFKLKGMSGEKEGGSGVFTIDRYWYGTLALDIKKIRNFAVVFYSIHFRYRPVQQNTK